MSTIEHKQIGAMSRRGFLGGAAGLTFALSIPGAILRPDAALAAGETAPSPSERGSPSARMAQSLLPIPAAEMGQGSLTGLAMVFAEEFDADWSTRVDDLSARDSKHLRQSHVRRHDGHIWQRLDSGLLGQDPAAGRRGATRSDAGGGRSLGRAACRASHRAEHGGPCCKQPQDELRRDRRLRSSAGNHADDRKDGAQKDRRLSHLGKTTPRLDIPAKTNGSAQYAHRRPGAEHGLCDRAAARRSTAAAPDQVDDQAALAVPGVLKVVPLPHSVGVVAESVEAAFAGRTRCSVSWSGMPANSYNSADGMKDFLARAAKLDDQGRELRCQGRC